MREKVHVVKSRRATTRANTNWWTLSMSRDIQICQEKQCSLARRKGEAENRADLRKDEECSKSALKGQKCYRSHVWKLNIFNPLGTSLFHWETLGHQFKIGSWELQCLVYIIRLRHGKGMCIKVSVFVLYPLEKVWSTLKTDSMYRFSNSTEIS